MLVKLNDLPLDSQRYKTIISSWLETHDMLVMQANNSSVLSFLHRDIRPPLEHESLNMVNYDL